MGENMNYPDNPIDFIKQYSFSDKQRVYTNGSELISAFRVGQMIEHYMSDLTPQQIKDMQFCLREKSRECAELRRELQEMKKRNEPMKINEIHVDEYRCPVGGIDRSGKIDKISLQNAVETPFWMMVWAAEPERLIDVRMSYSDLKIICDLIDSERNRRAGEQNE